MDKVIVTAFLIMAGTVSVVFAFNSIYPAVVASADALITRQRGIDERFDTQIEIVHAVAYGVATSTAYVWIKNIGSTTLKAVDRCDVFFGPEGDFVRIPYASGASNWTYAVENDTDWKPTATLKITINYETNLTDGERYFVKVGLPNGVSDEIYFTK